MANYKLDIKPNDVSLLQWAQAVNARNDAKAKESRDNMMNTLKILGLAGAAYQPKGNAMTESTGDYYDRVWSDYTPEDQVSMVNLGFNPSLYRGMNPQDDEFNYNIWGV